MFPIRLPLRKPFANARGVLTERRGLLVRLLADTGEIGWGESSPYPGFGLESLAQSRLALEDAARALLGREVEQIDELLARVAAVTAASPSARGAAETAVADLAARGDRLPLARLLSPTGGYSVRAIACNALLLGDELAALERAARSGWANGYRTFKLKVGVGDRGLDLARVARVREVLGPEASIRLDANGVFDEEQALRAVEGFARHEIEYLEQPLAASRVESMAKLRRRSPVPLAADEAAVCEADALRVIDAGAADVIVVKPSAAGGPLASLRIARAARRAGLSVVVTSLLDSAVGVAAALQVAAAIGSEGALPACGLATSGLFERDVARLDPTVRGCLPLPTGCGSGIEVDESLLRRCLDGPVVELSP
ncbi:MAG: o-succinylbenzoate synthase [bacterium]|nr:o-succinylbenzoate synthase [bacterium]